MGNVPAAQLLYCHKQEAVGIEFRLTTYNGSELLRLFLFVVKGLIYLFPSTSCPLVIVLSFMYLNLIFFLIIYSFIKVAA